MQEVPTDHLDIDAEKRDLLMDLEDKGLFDTVYKMANKFAATHVGQVVIERSDRLLRMIEETAKWSLPQDKSDEKLIRPFNWFIFLSLIALMRFIRIGLSVGSLMIGNSPITAYDVVNFLQTRRRKLRAIRVNGLKEIKRFEEESNALKYSNQGCFTSKISALLSIAICRPGQHREPGRRVLIRHGKPHECQEELERRISKSTLYEDCTDENLTFDELLSKYADQDSEDDSDYIPNPEEEEEESSDDPNSTSSSSSSSSNSPSEERQEEVTTSKKYATTVMSYKEFSLQHQATDDKEPTKSLESTTNPTRSNKSLLNQSIEIQKNGEHPHIQMPIPMPLPDMKTELLSDIDNASEQQEPSPRNHVQSSDGSEDPVPERGAQAGKNINAYPEESNNNEDTHKSTSTHGAVAKNTPKVGPGTTAIAASYNEDSPNTSRSLPQPNLLLSASSPSSSPLWRSLEDSESSTNRTLIVKTRKRTAATLSPATSPTPTTPESSPAAPSLLPRVRSEPVALSGRKTTLTSASSTEDLFYSPIGSPPNFDACFDSSSTLKNSTVSASGITEADFVHSSPQMDQEDCPKSLADNPLKAPLPPKKHTHQHQHSNRNRNRGRNRR